jgi:hypothetical protein
MVRTKTPEQAVVFKDIQHPAHLTKDQHTRTLLVHGLEKFVEDEHLARVLNEVLISSIRRTRFLGCQIQLRVPKSI